MLTLLFSIPLFLFFSLLVLGGVLRALLHLSMGGAKLIIFFVLLLFCPGLLILLAALGFLAVFWLPLLMLGLFFGFLFRRSR